MFACNYNNPCMPNTGEGAQGAQGTTGTNGRDGVNKVSTTYDFKLRLTGEQTQFNPVPTPSLTPISFSFAQAEFLHPTNMGIFIPINPQFPYVAAPQNTLATWGVRGAPQINNNYHFFYVMPKDGIITGYTVNFCAQPYGSTTPSSLIDYSKFGIGIASVSVVSPGTISFNTDNNIDILQTSSTINYGYSSAYHNLDTPKKFKAGNYLGCFCLHPNSGFAPQHAQGDTHMTAHVVFEE